MASVPIWPTVVDLAQAVRRGDRSAADVLGECLAHIRKLDPVLNAFVEVDLERARRTADAIDAAVARGVDPGPLAGVPFAVKDTEDVAGMPTLEGCGVFRDTPVATRDSVHVARLVRAGAVPVGKTTLPELALHTTTASRAHGVTRNPWDPDTTPGGSSGGSATAVAAGMVPLATATDGAGSIRIPAAYCGLVGLKPSHGRIPYPLPDDIACAGALAVSVADLARHLDVAAGPDGSDPFSLPAVVVRYEEAIEQLDLRGLRAAWSPDLGYAGVDPDVEGIAHDAAQAVAKAAGMQLVDQPFRLRDQGIAWALLAADQHLRRLIGLGLWPGRRDEFDPMTRLMLGIREALGPEHLHLAEVRKREGILATAELFEAVDVLFTPATAVTAPPAAGGSPKRIADQDLRLSGPVPFTSFVNPAGNPAASVPAGLSAAGMPVGLQIVGPRHGDEVVLRLARYAELERPWPRRPAEVPQRLAGRDVEQGAAARPGRGPEGGQAQGSAAAAERGGELPIARLARRFAWVLDPANHATTVPADW